jgi:hypothetical protein
MRIFLISVFAAALVSTTAAAQTPTLDSVALAAAARKVALFGHDAALVRAVRAQNAKQLSMADIRAIDQLWIAGNAEVRVAELLSNDCAQRLTAIAASESAFTELFVMDDQGANVCMSARTSDFWQGDEAKWEQSFNGGNGTTYIDRPRYDASAKAVLIQVSVPVVDGGKTIGAITVGINTSRVAAR